MKWFTIRIHDWRQIKKERKFQTFYGRIRAVLNGAQLKDQLNTKQA
jgi:hypothetical protein